MRGSLFLAPVLGLSLQFCQPSPSGRSLTLENGWKFRAGDDPAWAAPDWNDQEWTEIAVGEAWQEQGLDGYEGFGWYRLRFRVPARFVTAPYRRKLRLTLGYISDASEVFLNGRRLGQAGAFPPDDTGHANSYRLRQFFIAADSPHLQLDGENVVAVRVHDRGGRGGLYQGPYLLENLDFEDVVRFDLRLSRPAIALSPGKEVEFAVQIYNDLPEGAIEGRLQIRVFRNGETRPFQITTKDVVLEPGRRHLVDYHVMVPQATTLSASYLLQEPASGRSLARSELIGYVPHPRLSDNESMTPLVEKTVGDAHRSLPLESQTIESMLGERIWLNLKQRLFRIDERRLLDGYYHRPGNHPWIGEHVGKYLHAATKMWSYTQDDELKTQLDRIVDMLLATQLENGYLGTYSPPQYWTGWDVWSHKYNLAGLLAYYGATGYVPALDASRKIGDLLVDTFGTGTGQLDIIGAGEHHGMASLSVLDPMVDLYRHTGSKRYLEFCHYLVEADAQPHGPRVLDTLLSRSGTHQIANAKAYEMLSFLLGVLKLSQIERNERWSAAVEAAWNDIASKRLYITGTASSRERFQAEGFLPADHAAEMGEGCVTTTWLQLNQALFYQSGGERYMNEIEKSVYNHLLAAENPQDGCVSYYTPLQGKKPYTCTITCCASSIPRGIAVIPELLWTERREGGLAVSMYSRASFRGTLRTRDQGRVGVAVHMETEFPRDGNVLIKVDPDRSAEFPLSLRVPSWARNFVVRWADREIAGTPGSYLPIVHKWTSGSVVEVSFEIAVEHLDGGHSYPGAIAVKRGPQVLSVDSQVTSLTLPESWRGGMAFRIDGRTMVPYADAGQTGGDVRVWLDPPGR